MLKPREMILNSLPETLRGRIAGSGRSRRAWRDELAEAGRKLEAMTTGSEDAFLFIGEKLQDIHQRVRAMSKLSMAAAECLSGERITSEEDDLKGILRKIGAANDASLGGSATILSLISSLEEADSHVESFSSIVRNLRVLCNLIRIESARLGSSNEGFAALSDDVQALIAHMDASLSTLRGRIGQVLALMADHLLLARKFEASQQEKARQVLDRSRQSIVTMEKQQALSCLAVTDAARRWKNIAGRVGEVVSSLQFHDITRQRMEHVHEALTELMEERQRNEESLERKSPVARYLFFVRNNGSPADTPEVMSRAAATCELQAAQLQHAREDLGGAMERIGQNLSNISSEISMLSGDIQNVAGFSEEKKDTYFSEMEASLAKLKETIREFAEMNGKMSASMLQVAAAVGDMTSLVRDIQRVGITMRITALNACVHAAHIGASGMALGVLADSIQQLSVDTSGSIDSISSNLDAIGAKASALSRQGGRYDLECLEMENRALLDQIGSLMAPLRQKDEEMSGLLRQFDGNGNSLRQEIEEMGAHLQERQGIVNEIDTVALSLKSVTGELRAALPAGSGRTVEAALGNLAVRYTMDKEREIHSALTAQTAVAANLPALPEGDVAPGEMDVELWETDAAAPVALPDEETAAADLPPQTGDADDLGDNVELF
jgi:methyl-accepting chemotaxis protein